MIKKQTESKKKLKQKNIKLNSHENGWLDVLQMLWKYLARAEKVLR
jgi:hypothetical protein